MPGFGRRGNLAAISLARHYTSMLTQQTAILIVGLTIGVPIAAFVTLRLMKGYKRDVTAYDWSTAEVHRRGERISELEAALSVANARAHQLETELKRLQGATRQPEAPARLAANVAPPPPPSSPTDEQMFNFEVGIFNQAVRDALAQGKKHKDLADTWSEISYFNVVAASEQAARDQIAKRYPPSRGYVIAALSRMKS